LHPDQSDREAALFLQVQAAYKICDLYKLREIALLLDSKSIGEDNFESSYDELKRQVALLQEKVDNLKGKINVMNSSFPFMYRDKLFDEDWVKERQDAVKDEIEEFKSIKTRLQGIVDVMEEYKK
jgi:peptidoglycan hydrolase CwlO-like protein